MVCLPFPWHMHKLQDSTASESHGTQPRKGGRVGVLPLGGGEGFIPRGGKWGWGVGSLSVISPGRDAGTPTGCMGCVGINRSKGCMVFTLCTALIRKTAKMTSIDCMEGINCHLSFHRCFLLSFCCSRSCMRVTVGKGDGSYFGSSQRVPWGIDGVIWAYGVQREMLHLEDDWKLLKCHLPSCFIAKLVYEVLTAFLLLIDVHH